MLALSVPGLLSATSAQAATTSLPITSFYQIVADTAHNHLFISQGSSSKNEIIVTDLAGQQVATIDGQDGVMGIALSPDGSTLYAALGSSHAVTAISTTTLQQTASYSIGDANTPRDVAVQSGKVWVSYDTGQVSQAAVGDIDLSATTPGFETQSAMGGWYSAPELAADPQDSGILVAAQPAMDPSSVSSYNVSADPATVIAQNTFFQNCENEGDLAVVPGGAQFILACGAPYAHFRYSTADLSEQGSYASTTYPDAVAIDASGQVAAGTSNGGTSAPDLYIYNQGGDTPLSTFSLNKSGSDITARGLAWASDGSKLFAVLNNSATSSYTLQVIDDPTLAQPALTLSGPASAQITKPVTLTGKLTIGSGTPVSGAAITITRSVSGGTDKTFPVTTAADGSYQLTDTPPAAGDYTYTASYSGNSTTAAATASTTVNVTRIPVSLTVTTKSTVYTYKPTIKVTAHLGTTHGNRQVSIYAQPFGRAKTLLKTGTVNSSGNLTVSYAAAHSTTFSAVFSGDDRYAPKTVTHVIYVRAKVSESLSGYYSHARISGHTYYRFHRHSTMRAHATVAPNKSGECVKFQVQEYYRGAWHPNVTSPCLHLSSSSKATEPFQLTQADVGYHYRVRADYVRSSKDTTNRNNDSAWRYVIVER